jgi:2-methylcitrate dehydratase PrpD
MEKEHMARSMEALLDLVALEGALLPAASRRLAAFSLFDWMSVAIAGSDQPLCGIIRAQALAEGGAAIASVVGSPTKLPARAAALVNGTVSHALDYDDTHFAHIGHLSVGIYPAALAAAEEQGAGAAAVRDAFLVGAEGACRLGMVLGRGHYQRGFHQTATAGAFGATIAASRIYGLGREQARAALSLVATRASGLKSQFGTMGKPFNAGISASNGIEAASLARRGFTSCVDGIGGPQGFIETHAESPDPELPWENPPPGHFVFDAINYKLHACCHGTHAMIEALLKARREGKLREASLRRITVRTHPRWLAVCDIKKPGTGLEVKFSYGWLAAMIVSGINTSSEKAYVDELCDAPNLRHLAGRVEVIGDDSLSDTGTVVSVEADEGLLTYTHDLSAPVAHDALEQGLRAKAQGLLGRERAEGLWDAIRNIETLPASALGTLFRG